MTRWSESIFGPIPRNAGVHRLGVLPGAGVGPEVTQIALQSLTALESTGLADVEVVIDESDSSSNGSPLPAGIVKFCDETFAAGGAVLAGPYGGRFVYEMRARFDLFCKLSPIRPSPALRGTARLRPEALAGVDVLVVRENTGGVYQGRWSEARLPEGARVAEQCFSYTEAEVRRILEVAASLAARRRGLLSVVGKPGGIPTISRLWYECAGEIARDHGVTCSEMDVDYAAYRLVQQPSDLDVVVAPNLLGDVLCDVGAVLFGSRGLSYGASFSASGAAVYQTNHGAAYDLAGTGRANPVGHLHALAMLLRESFGLDRAATALERAIEEVWAGGFRTEDLAEPGATTVGAAELGERVAGAVSRRGLRRVGQ